MPVLVSHILFHLTRLPILEHPDPPNGRTCNILRRDIWDHVQQVHKLCTGRVVCMCARAHSSVCVCVCVCVCARTCVFSVQCDSVHSPVTRICLQPLACETGCGRTHGTTRYSPAACVTRTHSGLLASYALSATAEVGCSFTQHLTQLKNFY